jgi:hypothetical protein
MHALRSFRTADVPSKSTAIAVAKKWPHNATRTPLVRQNPAHVA